MRCLSQKRGKQRIFLKKNLPEKKIVTFAPYEEQKPAKIYYV